MSTSPLAGQFKTRRVEKDATFMKHEEKSIHPEANRGDSEGIRWRKNCGRNLSRPWHQSTNLVQLAEEVWRNERRGVEAIEGSRGRESALEKDVQRIGLGS